MAKIKTAHELETLRQSLIRERKPDRLLITVCNGSGCHAYGCEQVTAAFKEELKKHGLQARVEVKATGCHGFCERGPLVVLKPKNILYQRVQVGDVPEIVASSAAKNGIIERLLYEDPKTGRKITASRRHPLLPRTAAPDPRQQHLARPGLYRGLPIAGRLLGAGAGPGHGS